MLIEVSNTLSVNNPTKELMTWCKKNLVIANPEYAKKARMNLWLGNTPKMLYVHSPGSFRGRISRPSSLREEGSYQCDLCEADEQGGADRQAG